LPYGLTDTIASIALNVLLTTPKTNYTVFIPEKLATPHRYDTSHALSKPGNLIKMGITNCSSMSILLSKCKYYLKNIRV
jgi:hypothetical protein